jgi:hypothetical protein
LALNHQTAKLAAAAAARTTEARMQAGGHDGARDPRAENGVAVIQKAVDAEIRPEQKRPIAPRGLGLHVVRVAEPYLARQEIESAAGRADGGERRGLGQDLGAPQPRLQALLQRRARRDLVVHPSGLDVVRVDRPDDRRQARTA